MILTPCTFAEAKQAVEAWHYSGSMPGANVLRLAVHSSDEFDGVVIFGRGATPKIGSPYGLEQKRIAELCRVALRPGHTDPVSRIVACALRLLYKAHPEIRLVVSYADPAHGHHGGIYQAGNWTYTGPNPGATYRVECPDGVVRHPRSAYSLYGSHKGFPRIKLPKKHKYVYALDDAMRQQIKPLSRPYPSPQCGRSIEGDAPGHQSGQGGPNPTLPLPSPCRP